MKLNTKENKDGKDSKGRKEGIGKESNRHQNPETRRIIESQ
jgi:hypothetical protein